MIQPAATGMRDNPMTVMMLPVTTGGKNRTILEKNGAMTRPITPAAMTDPNTCWSPVWPPPELLMMVSIVETEAKEMPWTSGRWAPNNGTPRVCSTVASPLTKSALETSSPSRRR